LKFLLYVYKHLFFSKNREIKISLYIYIKDREVEIKLALRLNKTIRKDKSIMKNRKTRDKFANIPFISLIWTKDATKGENVAIYCGRSNVVDGKV